METDESYRIGIDIGGTKIAIGLANANLKILKWVSIPTRDDLEKESVLGRICNRIATLLNEQQAIGKNLVAVGLGFPGELDPITKLIKTAPNNQSFIDTDPAALLQEALQTRFGLYLPVKIDNDASVAALAEAKLGAGKDARKQLYLTVSTDVGGARFDGSTVFNIEPGLFVFPDSQQPDVPLGHLAGGVPAAQLAKSQIRIFIREHGSEKLSHLTNIFDRVEVTTETLNDQIENLTAEMLGEASSKGDRFAQEIFSENARQLARGIAVLLAEGFSEEKIILGGSVATKVPFYIDMVKAALKELQDSQTANQGLKVFNIEKNISLAEIGDERGILGAILLTGQEEPKVKPTEIFITGASGLIGSAILKDLEKHYKVLGSYYKNSQLGLTKLDITNREAVFNHLSKIRPKIVIHAAFLTNVDSCRKHPQEVFAVNVEGTRNLADACQHFECTLRLISLGFRFSEPNQSDGRECFPDPLNICVQTKLKAEQIVTHTYQDYFIVRSYFDLRKSVEDLLPNNNLDGNYVKNR